MPLRPELCLLDVIQASDEIASRVAGLDRRAFSETRAIYMAVFGELIVIGEAAANLDRIVRERHPEIDWVAVIGLRNVLAHQYFQVDWARIWEVATADVPKLREQMESILRAEFPLAAEALDRKNGERPA